MGPPNGRQHESLPGDRQKRQHLLPGPGAESNRAKNRGETRTHAALRKITSFAAFSRRERNRRVRIRVRCVFEKERQLFRARSAR